MDALSHPVRREILRALHSANRSLSPKDVSARLSPRVALSNIGHHARQLRYLGLIEVSEKVQVRGAVQPCYRSLVAEDRSVCMYLQEHEKWDGHMRIAVPARAAQ